MNILLVLNEQSDKENENALNKFCAAAQNRGIDPNGITLKTTKTALMRTIEAKQDFDIVVCRKYLEAGSCITIEDLERIVRTAKSGLRIIIIIENLDKGTDYVRRLIGLGIYNAIFEEDASFKTILDRIEQPFAIKDATSYYGITQPLGRDSSIDSCQQMLSFITGFDGSLEDLRNRLIQASDRMSADELLEVLVQCPDEILDRAGFFENFKYVAEIAKKEKEKRSGLSFSESGQAREPEDPDAEAGKKKRFGFGKNKAKEKKQKKQKQKKQENKRPLGAPGVEIAFISTNKGVGCTHSAIACAFSLADSGFKTAIVEIDDADKNFSDLARQLLKRSDVEGIMSYEFGGVDFYLNMPFSMFKTNHRAKYDYVVYDFGCCPNKVIETGVVTCERVFVIASPQEYKYGELIDFVEDAGPIDLHNKFIYLFPLCERSMLGRLRELTGTDKMDAVPMDRNPFHPAKNTRALFTGYVENPEFKANFNTGPSLEERLLKPDRQDKKLFSVISIALLAVTAASLSLVLFITGISSWKEIAELKDSLSQEREYSSMLSDNAKKAEAQMAEYVRKVAVMKEPQAAGTLITADMLTEKEIMSSEPQDRFVSTEDAVGKYTACCIEEDMPIYRYYVAEKAAAPLENAEQGTDGGEDADENKG